MRKLIPLLFFLLSYVYVSGQCSCVNCPFPTISNAVVTDTIFIAGATSNVLGSGGQDLQKICINFIDDAIEEKEIILESPSGDQVTLALNSGISVGDNITFEICWVACNETAMPDSGFPANFDTDAGWADDATYTGCYYPWIGCLEDFTGSVDGPWVLIIEDHIGLDDAIIFDWTLSFYDDSGLNCVETGPCVYIPPPCDADGGELTSLPITACQGSQDLDLTITPEYPGGSAPPATLFGYTFVLVDLTTDVIVSINQSTDYTSLIPGMYMICGFSYALAEAGGIPTPNGTYTYTDLVNFLAGGGMCGDLSSTCINMTIEGNGVTPALQGELLPCTGAIESYLLNPTPGPGEMYVITVTGGTIISQTANTVEIEWQSTPSMGEICLQIVGGTCPSPLVCIDITISDGYQLPTMLDAPSILCIASNNVINIPFDPNILTYNWSGSGISVIAGQGTNEATFTVDQLGQVQICLDITTICGPQGPLCASITVIEIPQPVILPNIPSCDLEFTLQANITPGNSANWSLNAGPGNANINNPNSATTLVTVTQSGTYEFLFIESNGICQAEILVLVEVLDGPSISAPTFNCNLNNEYTLTFTISGGVPPYLVDGIPLSGSTYTSGFIPSGSTYGFIIEDNIGCVLNLDGDYTCPCQSDAGTVPLDINFVCDGPNDFVVVTSNGDAILENDDIGVYILHDNPTDILGTVIEENTTGIFVFSPPIQYGVTYYISYVVGNDLGGTVDISDPCLSVSQGQPVIFYQSPEVDVIIPPIICELSFELEAMSLLGVDNFIWSLISGPGTVAFSPIDGFPTSIFVTDPGTYTFNLELSNPGCIVNQEVVVDVLPPPQVLTTIEECDLSGGAYTVSFNVNGGTSPYTADIGGAFNGNVFISDPIPSGDPYVITVTDANGCESFQIIGVKLCDCFTNAGNMELTPIEICGTIDSVQTIHQGNFDLDPDDLGLYYLHDANSNILGNVISLNDSGIFYFEIGMNLDQWYYVSFVVGNDVGGSIDLTDPCLDVSVGQPVIWHLIPDVILGQDLFTCIDTIDVLASPSDGQWSTNSTYVSFDNVTDSMTTMTMSDFGIYTIYWTSLNGFCSDQDSLEITYQDGPQISNQLTECSDDLLTFVYSFDINSSADPFEVNGVEIVGNTFTSSELTASMISQFTIIDASGCNTEIEVGPINCACDIDPGTIDDSDISLCAGDDLLVNISNLDYTINAGDTVAYILHDGNGSPLGNIIEISYGDVIPYSGSIIDGSPYYLNVVVGNVLGTAIDLNDPCLGVSEGAQVTWSPINEVMINGSSTICIGENVEILIESQGPYPFEISLSNEHGDIITEMIAQNSQIISWTPNNPSETWLIVDVNSICYIIEGNYEITVDYPNEIILVDQTTLCNNPLANPMIVLDDLILSDIYPGEWFTPGLTAVNGVVSFSNVPAGQYIFTYTTIGYQGACPGTDYMTTIIVEDCDCPMLDFIGTITICNGFVGLPLINFDTEGWNGVWSVINTNGLFNPVEIDGTIISIKDKTPGSYIIRYTITDPILPECDDFFEFELIVEAQLQAGIVNDTPMFCQGEDEFLLLSSLLDNADIGGQWYYQGTVVTETVSIGSLSPGLYEYSYIIPATSSCLMDQAIVSIEILETPEFDVEVTDILCFGEQNGSIAISVNGNNGPFSYYVDNNLQVDDGVFNNLSVGVYSVKVVDANGCDLELNNIVVNQPAPLAVNLGPDVLVFAGTIVDISADASILELDIDSISWVDNNGVILENGLFFSMVVTEDVLVTIEIFDKNGCTAFDDKLIEVQRRNIYLPNVFNPNSVVGNEQFGLTPNSGVEEIIRFSVYDRWGNKVYHAENISPDTPDASWDGKLLGKPVGQGVYVYLLDVRFPDGKTESFSGDITVLRGK